MQLKLEDVVLLFDVTENQVHRWIQDEGLPVQIVNERYRFSRIELLEWATARGIRFSPAMFGEINGEAEQCELFEALEYGGVKRLAVGKDSPGLRSVVLDALQGMPMPENFHRDQLVELLMARHMAGSTAIGSGIAIPHARYPVLLVMPRPAIRLCLLADPIPFDAPDGQPVDTLFLMVCSTIHEHLRLLAKLAALLRVESFRTLLRTKSTDQELLQEVRRWEQAVMEGEMG